MAHLKRLASCLLAVLLVITLIPGGVLTTAEAAANLEPEPVVNREDNVTLSKTAVQTAIDEWEVTLRISGGGSTTVKPQIDIVLVTDYSSSMDKHVYGSGICGSTSFRADEEENASALSAAAQTLKGKGALSTATISVTTAVPGTSPLSGLLTAGGVPTAGIIMKAKKSQIPARRM